MNEKDSRVNVAALDRYREAIDTLARWCNEDDNPELTEDERAALVACYGAGCEKNGQAAIRRQYTSLPGVVSKRSTRRL